MITLHVTFGVLVCALTLTIAEKQSPFSDHFVNLINSKQNSWKAGRNFPLNTSFAYIKKLMGTLKDENLAKLPKVEHDAQFIANLPKYFDPRDKWLNCPSLNEIRDQGACSSCWAIGAVETMTDRYCIYSNGTQQFHFSVQDLINCCETCGLGCIRGFHAAAWEYWKHVGLVSGGGYNSNHGCKAYKVPPGGYYYEFGNLPSPGQTFDVSECVPTCDSSYSIEYKKDKHHGKNIYSIDSNEEQIKAELFKNGPVEGVMAVYTDFLHYKQGVYHHTEGRHLGHHAVKILGWGMENDDKYWLVANSWSQNWGANGFFKIMRGKDHCGIEGSIVTGEPLIL